MENANFENPLLKNKSKNIHEKSTNTVKTENISQRS